MTMSIEAPDCRTSEFSPFPTFWILGTTGFQLGISPRRKNRASRELIRYLATWAAEFGITVTIRRVRLGHLVMLSCFVD